MKNTTIEQETKEEYGAFILLPLKFDRNIYQAEEPDFIFQEKENSVPWKQYDWRGTDFIPEVEKLLCKSMEANIGLCYSLDTHVILTRSFTKARNHIEVSSRNDPNNKVMYFSFKTCNLFVFYTGVAFLCLGIRYFGNETLNLIVNPGQLGSLAEFSYIGADQKKNQFMMLEVLQSLIDGLYLDFYSTNQEKEDIGYHLNLSSVFSDACVLNLARIDGGPNDLTTYKHYAYNLRRMKDIHSTNNEEIMQKMKFVYPLASNTLEWCVNVSNQVISMAHDSSIDMEGLMQDELCNRVVLTVLALYKRYSCMVYTQKLYGIREDNGRIHSQKEYDELHDDILDFMTFGTISAEGVSNWESDREYYNYLLEVFGFEREIAALDKKMGILLERMNEREESRKNQLGAIIATFGIVSILSDASDIMSVFFVDNNQIRIITILSVTSILITLYLLYSLIGMMHRRRVFESKKVLPKSKKHIQKKSLRHKKSSNKITY